MKPRLKIQLNRQTNRLKTSWTRHIKAADCKREISRQTTIIEKH
jgi:hypothetical protein